MNKIFYIWINLTKKVKALHTENSNILMKEINMTQINKEASYVYEFIF